MKTVVSQIIANSQRAKHFVVESLRICSYKNYVSTELHRRYGETLGDIYSISESCINPEADGDYQGYDPKFMAQPHDGKYERPFPLDVASDCVQRFLKSRPEGAVVVEQFAWGRKHALNSPLKLPRCLFLDDRDVYLLLTRNETDEEVRQDALRGFAHWQTCVFADWQVPPGVADVDTQRLDELVTAAVASMVLAYDTAGFLLCATCPEHNELVRAVALGAGSAEPV